jgi:hypothetical protein
MGQEAMCGGVGEILGSLRNDSEKAGKSALAVDAPQSHSMLVHSWARVAIRIPVYMQTMVLRS